jgi:hypothetical protein
MMIQQMLIVKFAYSEQVQSHIQTERKHHAFVSSDCWTTTRHAPWVNEWCYLEKLLVGHKQNLLE